MFQDIDQCRSDVGRIIREDMKVTVSLWGSNPFVDLGDGVWMYDLLE